MIEESKKLIKQIKTPNKQAEHAKNINQPTSKQISLLVRPMCPNVRQVDKTKHLLVKKQLKHTKRACSYSKNNKKNATS